MSSKYKSIHAGAVIDQVITDVPLIIAQISTPETLSLTLDKDATISSVLDSYASPSDASCQGASLYQAVANGNFASGTTGWILTNATHSVTNNVYSLAGNGGGVNAYGGQEIGVFSVGGKNFVKFRFRITNSVCVSAEVSLRKDTLFGTIVATFSVSNPVENQWYESPFIATGNDTSPMFLSFRHGYADAATANGKVMEIDGTGTNGVMAIPMTGTPYENYTADQMNVVANKYFEGLKSIESVSFGSRDIADVVISQVNITCNDNTKFDMAQVPNLTSNSVDLVGGKFSVAKRVARYVLTEDDIDLSTTTTNIDVVTIIKPTNHALYNVAGQTLVNSQKTLIPNFSPINTVLDDIIFIGNHYNRSATLIGIIVAKNEYVSAAAAKTALAGTVIYYQLATPVVKDEAYFADFDITVTGSLSSNLDYTEYFVDDYDILPSAIDIEYATNISRAVEQLKNGYISLKEFQTQQNLINLEFDLRITVLEP